MLCRAAVQLDPDAEDLLRGLLTWEPQQRLGSKGVHQIQQHPFFATVGWGRVVDDVQRDQQAHAQLKQQQQQQPVAGESIDGSSNGSYGGYSRMESYSSQGADQRAAESESPAYTW